MKKILSTAPLLRLVLEIKLQMYTEGGKFYDLNYRKCGCSELVYIIIVYFSYGKVGMFRIYFVKPKTIDLLCLIASHTIISLYMPYRVMTLNQWRWADVHWSPCTDWRCWSSSGDHPLATSTTSLYYLTSHSLFVATAIRYAMIVRINHNYSYIQCL